MRFASYCLVVFLTVFSSAQAEDKAIVAKASLDALHQLSGLIGSWKANMGGSAVYESWQADSSNRFKGMGFSVNGNDTDISEKLIIAATDSGLYYISDVSHNPAPVYFKMTRQDSTTTVWENPNHDFPTRIIYRLPTADSLHARIEGLRKGKESGIDFIFQRVK